MIKHLLGPSSTIINLSNLIFPLQIPYNFHYYSFVPYKFKKKYSPQSELLEYTNYVIDRFDLRKNARTNQAVTKLTYEESKGLWHVEVESGER